MQKNYVRKKIIMESMEIKNVQGKIPSLLKEFWIEPRSKITYESLV